MTAYAIPRAHTLSLDVAERRAARKKVIERAHRIERESYKAMMRKRRMLQGAATLDTIAYHMNNDELLGKIADFLNPIAKDILYIKTELLHVKTAVDALKAGQDDVRAELTKKAEKADIHRVEQKLDKSNKHLQEHEERLEALEEDQQSTHKNYSLPVPSLVYTGWLSSQAVSVSSWRSARSSIGQRFSRSTRIVP